MPSNSMFLELNGKAEKQTNEAGIPLEGTQIVNGNIIVRFHDGLMDGDSYTADGKLQAQPAIETSGHMEYWRKGHIHRDDNLPAVISKGFSVKEYWTDGNYIKTEKNDSE